MSYTISCWFRGSPGQSERPLIAMSGQYDLRITSQGHIRFCTPHSSFTTTLPFNDGLWHQVVVVGGTTIYVDERIVDVEHDASAIPVTRDEPLQGGYIWNVAVWDVALDEDAVRQLYNGGVPMDIFPGNLVSWHSLGDGDSPAELSDRNDHAKPVEPPPEPRIIGPTCWERIMGDPLF